MSLLLISEFAELGSAGGHSQPIAKLPVVFDQTPLTIGSHVESSAFKTVTKYVRLHAEAACYLAFGTAPTAVTATGIKLAANQTEYFEVPPGQAYKVSVVA